MQTGSSLDGVAGSLLLRAGSESTDSSTVPGNIVMIAGDNSESTGGSILLQSGAIFESNSEIAQSGNVEISSVSTVYKRPAPNPTG